MSKIEDILSSLLQFHWELTLCRRCLAHDGVWILLRILLAQALAFNLTSRSTIQRATSKLFPTNTTNILSFLLHFHCTLPSCGRCWGNLMEHETVLLSHWTMNWIDRQVPSKLQYSHYFSTQSKHFVLVITHALWRIEFVLYYGLETSCTCLF